MEFGFIPSEFEVLGNDEKKENIILCRRALVPQNIPDNVVFIAKEKASASDFVQMMTIFDDAFKNIQANFVVLALGEFDISKTEKRLKVNTKTQEFDFFLEQKQSKEMALNSVNALTEIIREICPMGKIVSVDPLSRVSAGHHNSAVDFIRKRVAQVDEKHTHISTWSRFQRDSRRKKFNNVNFPVNEDAFVAEGQPTAIEIENIISAALVAMRQEEGEDKVVVGDVTFKKLF